MSYAAATHRNLPGFFAASTRLGSAMPWTRAIVGAVLGAALLAGPAPASLIVARTREGGENAVRIGSHVFTLDELIQFRDANPERFELIAENQLGTEGFSSPAVSENQLFLRVPFEDRGRRQEWLYCIAE